jgi:hypothetical protein
MSCLPSAWWRTLPAWSSALVKDGKAAAVRDYLDALALGGFA